jgi:hypothetical protein
MIENTINELKTITVSLQGMINDDIKDVKNANHEELLDRNEIKLSSMEKLSALKQQLNSELTQEYQQGVDVSIYKDSIDKLETELKALYYLNGRLASIVLPVKEMYKEIIDDITSQNGGSLVEVRA